jgi:hypothetical protein
MLNRALRHLQSGLDLLDDTSAPGHIGASIDLAVHQLERTIGATVEGEVPEPSGKSSLLSGETREDVWLERRAPELHSPIRHR